MSLPVAPPRGRVAPNRYHSFESCVAHTLSIVDKQRSSTLASNQFTRSMDCDKLISLTDHMVGLLSGDENSPDGLHADLLDLFLAADVMGCLEAWGARAGQEAGRLRVRQLCAYDVLLGRQGKQVLLLREDFVTPLFRLVAACVGEREVEDKLVLVLHQVCVGIARHTTTLDLLFNSDPPFPSGLHTDLTSGADRPQKSWGDPGGVSRPGSLVFSLLVPHVHREGVVGQQARDALLLMMSLTATCENVTRHVVEQSDFCPVLAAGLSGLYSSLPRTLTYPSNDWHQITRNDFGGGPDLRVFLNSLEFCNAVALVAAARVRDQLLHFIYNGFLVPVLGPALLQSLTEETIAATAYLEVFLRTITEPQLLRVFLEFILLARLEELSVLDTLIARIGDSNMRLCMVTLTLFQTLVDLNCEDVMYQLIFRHLRGCAHMMVSQQRALRDSDTYCNAAERLFSLIPAWCCDLPPATGSLGLPSASGGAGPIDAGRREKDSDIPEHPSGTSVVSPPPVPHGTLVSSLFQRLPSFRRKSGPAPSGSVPSSRRSSIVEEEEKKDDVTRLAMRSPNKGASAPPAHVDSTPRSPLIPPVESSYAEYLHDARRRVHSCARACVNWSALYDGASATQQGASAGVRVTSAVKDSSERPSDLNNTPAAKSANDATNSGVGTNKQKVDPDLGANLFPTSPTQDNEGDEGFVDLPPLSDDTRTSSPSSSCLAAPDSAAARPDDDLDVFMRELSDRLKVFCGSANKDDGVVYCSNIDDFEAFISRFEPCDVEGECAGKNTGDDAETSSEVLHETSDLCEPGVVDLSVSSLGVVAKSVQTANASLDNAWSLEGEAVKSSSSRDGVGDFLRIREKSDVGVAGIASECVVALAGTYSSDTPKIGPFLAALLHKLESMKQNTLYVNLLLTGLLARLAAYPQPLLRSLLLSPAHLFQPDVRSLFQVLGSIRLKLDECIGTLIGREILLAYGHRFLLSRDDPIWAISGPGRPGGIQPPAPPNNANGSLFPVENVQQFFVRLISKPSPAAARRNQALGQRTGMTSAIGEAEREAVEKRNAEKWNTIYGALVFKEFIKELAALSQEHAIMQLDDIRV